MLPNRTSLSKIERFKSEIIDSVTHSARFNYENGAEYNTGFCRHSGMVMRVYNCSISHFLLNQLDKFTGRTCVLDMVGENTVDYQITKGISSHEELCDSTVLREILSASDGYNAITVEDCKCAYIPRVTVVNGYGDKAGVTDVVYSKLPKYYGNYLADYTTYVKLRERIQLSIHVAACNRVDTLIIPDYNNCLEADDIKVLAESYHGIGGLYHCHISNILFVVPDEDNYRIFRETIGGE